MTISLNDVLELAKRHQMTLSINGQLLRMRAPQKPPDDVIELVKQRKPEIMAWLLVPRYRLFRFTLDNNTVIQAIRPDGFTLAQMQQHLHNKFGPDRISEVMSVGPVINPPQGRKQ
jgi:hypothetical protein